VSWAEIFGQLLVWAVIFPVTFWCMRWTWTIARPWLPLRSASLVDRGPYRSPASSTDTCLPSTPSHAEQLRAAGAIAFRPHGTACVTCKVVSFIPAGRCSAVSAVRFRACRGTWRCAVRVEHIHAKCDYCGARRLMAPADVDLGGAT
jgi:hypothetical protein